jgi:hypothetical protein
MAHTIASIEAEFKRLGYNMLDCKKTAAEALANPGKEYAALKKLSHQALTSGRDFMNNDDNQKANSNFAFAYQMRCVADWIWINLMHNEGDLKHHKFLELSREFGKLATGKLDGKQKEKIRKEVDQLHE